MAECPLLAQSGHSFFASHMSAFGGKADIVLGEFYEHTPSH